MFSLLSTDSKFLTPDSQKKNVRYLEYIFGLSIGVCLFVCLSNKRQYGIGSNFFVSTYMTPGKVCRRTKLKIFCLELFFKNSPIKIKKKKIFIIFLHGSVIKAWCCLTLINSDYTLFKKKYLLSSTQKGVESLQQTLLF